MTAQKPRVYVMESQSFNLTPPPQSIPHWGLMPKEIHANVLYRRTALLEKPVAWRWKALRKIPKESEKKETHSPGITGTHTRRHTHRHRHRQRHTPRIPAWLSQRRCGVGLWEMKTGVALLWHRHTSCCSRRKQLDLIRQCGVWLGLSLQQSVHRMHPPLAFDAVQIHPPLLRVMN